MHDNKGKFLPGNPGKQKGTTNKLTRTVRETVLAAFTELQADPVNNIVAWAKTEPTEFYKIAAKLIPTEIKGDLQITKTVLHVERKTGNNLIEDITPESEEDS